MSTPARSSSRWWTLVIVSLSAFMLILDLSIVAIALPSIRSDLHASFSDLQWAFDAYALTLAAFLVIAGSIADRYGRKRIFLGGLAIFGLASIACGLASGVDMLNVSRGVQGVGAAIMFAVGPAILGHEFHGKERPMAFSAFGAATGVAAAGGPLLGGALTSGPGWRWIFLMNVPVCVVLIPLAMKTVRESRLARVASPDIIGMVTFTVSLAAIVLAIIRGNDDGWWSATNVALYVVSAACLILFLVVARSRGENAMFDLKMFRSRTFLGVCLATLLVNAGGMPFIFIATTYIQNVLHNSAWEAGIKFLPMTLVMFVCGALGGALPKKVPFKVILAIGVACVGTGCLLTSLSDADGGFSSLVPALLLAGAGIGLFMPTRAALSIGVFEPEKSGVASGINETFQQVGIALGLAIAGAVFENRVIAAFRDSATGAALGHNAKPVGSAISAGGIDTAAKSVGPSLAQRLTSDALDSFTKGFHQTMVFCSFFAFAAALVALFTVSNKQLHESALTGIPPEIPEEDQVPVPAG